MWIIATLGNPGVKYELTRHNIGFLVADALVRKYDGSFSKNFAALHSQIKIDSKTCQILKPQTFMNKSGESVLAASTFYKVKPENIIVVHDDLDLPLGELKIKKGGGHGGHNGLKDITNKIGPEFIRVRLGIGRPEFKGAESDYVLSNFNDDEFKAVEEIIFSSITALEMLVTKDLEYVQQVCQIKKP